MSRVTEMSQSLSSAVSVGRSKHDQSFICWQVDQFLDSLINYDKENIHENNLKAVQPYLTDPEFDADFIRNKSAAAAGLCSWAVNIVKFYHVYCDVEPKRKALEGANAELSAAEEKLAKIKAKIAELDQNLAELTASFEKATAEKLKCQQEAESTARTIELANRLVGGLASENVRWAESVNNFKEQEKTLPGDVLLTTAFVSYVGCFTRRYRDNLMHNKWLPYLKQQKVGDDLVEMNKTKKLVYLCAPREFLKECVCHV